MDEYDVKIEITSSNENVKENNYFFRLKGCMKD